MIEYLCNVTVLSNVEMNATSRAGMTPLQCAAAFNHEEAARLLIKHGADATAELVWGMRPHDVARVQGHRELGRTLRLLMEEQVAETQRLEAERAAVEAARREQEERERQAAAEAEAREREGRKGKGRKGKRRGTRRAAQEGEAREDDGADGAGAGAYGVGIARGLYEGLQLAADGTMPALTQRRVPMPAGRRGKVQGKAQLPALAKRRCRGVRAMRRVGLWRSTRAKGEVGLQRSY